MDTMTPDVLAADKSLLLAEANTAHEQYPQYAGHWDGWVVAEAVRDLVHPKWGDLVLAKGKRCLLDPTRMEHGTDRRGRPCVFVTVYLAANLSGCDTSWPASDFTVLG